MSYGFRCVLKNDNPADGDHSAVGTSPCAPISMDDRSTLRLTLAVTKATGTTPTLDVTLQTSENENGPWRTLGTFTQATAVSSERKCFAAADRFVRASFAIGGTSPAFRFTIIGDAL